MKIVRNFAGLAENPRRLRDVGGFCRHFQTIAKTFEKKIQNEWRCWEYRYGKILGTNVTVFEIPVYRYEKYLETHAGKVPALRVVLPGPRRCRHEHLQDEQRGGAEFRGLSNE